MARRLDAAANVGRGSHQPVPDHLGTCCATSTGRTRSSPTTPAAPREQLVPFWECVAPRTYMGWGKSTQLGYGLGLIMGAKLAEPDKLCVNIMGDAAVGMVGMDIETAVRNRLGILSIVFDNDVMAIERNNQPYTADTMDSLALGGDYKTIAEALGAWGRVVDKPDDFIPALEEAIAVTETGRPGPARLHRQGRLRLLALLGDPARQPPFPRIGSHLCTTVLPAKSLPSWRRGWVPVFTGTTNGLHGDDERRRLHRRQRHDHRNEPRRARREGTSRRPWSSTTGCSGSRSSRAASGRAARSTRSSATRTRA